MRTVGRVGRVRLLAPIRAASWLRDGRRFIEEGLEASEAGCEGVNVRSA